MKETEMRCTKIQIPDMCQPILSFLACLTHLRQPHFDSGILDSSSLKFQITHKTSWQHQRQAIWQETVHSLRVPTTFRMSTYLIVEPAALLQGGQISLCDSQFESGAQNKVWITLRQRTTHNCCHFLHNQFTQGLKK